MRLRPDLRLPRVGAYEIERLLGTGGMAEVFAARRVGPHGFAKRVALKRILPQLAADPRLVAMFCDEARIQSALCHPSLVQVLDFGEHDGELFMVLEYVDGLNCSELITRVAARRTTVDVGPALYIVREVLEALAYVHSAVDERGRSLGIVHRDVAPSNILLGKMGEVKLGDFGIVRSAAIDQRTAPGELKGKVGYCSPEQALGARLDAKSDLFSVGVVLAELLMCHPLFPGNSELEILVNLQRVNLRALDRFGGHIPNDVRTIIERTLSHDAGERYASAEELAHAIERCARAHGVSLGAHVLAEWMTDLGLLSISSDVRAKPAARLELNTATPPGRALILPVTPPDEREDADLPRQPASTIPEMRAAMPSEYPFVEAVELCPTELESEPPVAGETLADALAQLVPESSGRYSVPDELAHALSTRLPSILPRRPALADEPAELDVEYRVRKSGGAVVGPFLLARLLELVGTGRVGPETEVSRDGGPFIALGSLFELSRLAARPAYRFQEPFGLRARDRGPIRIDTLPRAIFALARGRRTGLLCARRGAEQARIYFVGGAPIFTASADPRELVGARLVADGVIQRGELEQALELGWRRGLRTGDALVDAGLVRPASLHRALVEQRRRRLVALLRLRAGEVAWIEGAECGEEPVPTGAPLKLAAACVLEAYGKDDVANALANVEHGGLLEPAEDALALAHALELPPAETEALARALRGRSLRTLVQEGVRVAGFSPEAAHRAVFVGLAAGVLIHRA